ncbi:unnamed protein product, partial [Effrenium voratum]
QAAWQEVPKTTGSALVPLTHSQIAQSRSIPSFPWASQVTRSTLPARFRPW